MAFTAEEQRKIIEEIGRRALPIGQGKCPACETSEDGFTIAPGFVFMFLQDTTQALTSQSGNGIPVVALVCGHCGHTMFFNLLTLRLSELVNPEPPRPEPPPFTAFTGGVTQPPVATGLNIPPFGGAGGKQ